MRRRFIVTIICVELFCSLNIITAVVALSLSVLVLSGCSDGIPRHTPSFAAFVSRIESCDTVGLAESLSKLKEEHADLGIVAQIDADVLNALYSGVKCDDERAIRFSEAAISAISDQPDSASSESLRLVSDMFAVKSYALLRTGDWDGAYANASDGEAFAMRASAPWEISKLLLVRAAVDRMRGRLVDCLFKLRSVEFLVDTAKSLSYERRFATLHKVAEASIDICHLNAATRLLTKASEFYDKVSDNSKINYLYQLLRLHVLMGDYGKSVPILSRLEMLMRKSNLKGLEPCVDAFHALARCRLGDVAVAETYANRVVRVNSSSDANVLKLLSLAAIWGEEGKCELAFALLNDSLRINSGDLSFFSALSSDVRLRLSVLKDDYKSAYEIQNEQRSLVANAYNDLFAYDDYQRISNICEHLRHEAHETVASVKLGSVRLRALAVAISSTLLFAFVVLLAKYYELKKKSVLSELTTRQMDDYEKRISELSKQADMLEVTNDRITESIAYAEHIQHAISPSPDRLNSYPITGSFIFFSPLDVVSGDFFWFTTIGRKLLVCCADCTGHGVPGALLSMISATILNDICTHLSEDDVDPGVILEKLDCSLIENLTHNREQGAKDGLDVSLVVLDFDSHHVMLASARRPVVIARGGKLTTIRGTRRSIGDLEPIVRQRPFETSELTLAPGDCIYMYSDGYSDQFGGRNGEKLKNSMVERFLSKICQDDMDQQSLAIQEMFVQWKGDFPQTDDVTFVGLCV